MAEFRPITDIQNQQTNQDQSISTTSKEIPTEDQELIRKLELWYDEADKAMSQRRERWRKNEELYWNRVVVYGKTGWTELKFALAIAIIRTEMSIISDHLPSFDVIGEEEDDTKFANMVQKRKEQILRKANFYDRVLDCIHDSLEYSNGIIEVRKVINDNKLSLSFLVVDPFTWLPSPYATGFDIRSQCRYQMFASPIHIDIIKRTYENGKYVQPEGFLDDKRAFHKVVEPSSTGKIYNYALIKECYFMDDDISLYPNGRCVVWANEIKLDDIALGIEDEITGEDGNITKEVQKEEISLVPYFMIGNYRTAHSVFGVGEAELVRTQIQAFNQIMSSLADNIKKQGNPIRKIRKRLYNQIKKAILGVAGEEIEVIEPDDVTWDIPPNVPSHTWNFLEWLLKLTETVTGTQDVTQGRRPVGVTAGVAIAELQEAAQTSIRYKIKKYVNPFFIQIGTYIVYLIQKLDNEIKQIRDYTTIEPSYTIYDPQNKYDVNGLQEGNPEFNPDMAKSMKESSLELEIVTGIRLPAGRYEDEARSTEKFEKGIYGIEEVTKFEQDRESIVKRFYERQGIAQLKERQEALNKAFEEFTNLLDNALSGNGEWVGSKDESQMARLLQSFPELLNTDDFKSLPGEFKDRLLNIFKQGENNIQNNIQQ